MIPISDTNSDRIRKPLVNYALIALNIFVFIYYQDWGTNLPFLYSFSAIPHEIMTGNDVIIQGMGATPIPIYGTLITSMFMHGSLSHIAGNMLYLWIFGDNLENSMGHLRYLMFYLLCGLLAVCGHIFYTQWMGQDMMMPMLGASGAISGVLGGYLILYPKNEIRVFAGILFLRIPAFITLGLWILMQFYNNAYSDSEAGGGVAYAAHIVGFIAGVLLVKFFTKETQDDKFSLK